MLSFYGSVNVYALFQLIVCKAVVNAHYAHFAAQQQHDLVSLCWSMLV